MDGIIFLITGIVGLISGILILLRPKWFGNLWKIRTAYEYWGEKAASRYYYVLEVWPKSSRFSGKIGRAHV